MSRHDNPTDNIRDELFSYIQRCDVIGATREDQRQWLSETMDFLATRHPHLTDLQLAMVEAMGKNYLKPVVPHGADAHHGNRSEWQDTERQSERAPEAALAETA